MIKLNKNEDSWLRCFVRLNGINTTEQKYKAIEKVVSNRPFGFERNLAVVQAILDGEWEVEGSMSIDEFKEEYKMLKCEYNKMRLNGDITANRVYQEAVVKLVKDFLEEVE